MADPEALALICEDWLRRLRRDGAPLPAPRIVAELARVAVAAPAVAAQCPALLAAVGPRVAYLVSVQASAPDVPVSALAATDAASWLTPAAAASALGVTPHQVRRLARRGRLDARRTETGWRVAAASVENFGRRRDRAG